MSKNIFIYLLENKEFFLKLLIEHINIVIISSVISIIVGVVIGIIIVYYEKVSNIVISLINVIYTIPAIAMLGALIPFTGIGNKTAIISLILYSLLPIVRSTYISIKSIDKNILEASLAMGSTEMQILMKIKLPLAFPLIFSAIKNMVVMNIALTSIASFVGAGGLGVAIYRGITTNNINLIMCGSILTAGLALITDFLLSIIEKYKIEIKSVLVIGVSLLICIYIFTFEIKKPSINIASKPTTEGYILTEIVSQEIENKLGIKVNITHGVGGGTTNIHKGMLNKDFDIYAEYTGTAWQVVLKEESKYTDDKFDILKSKYKERYNFNWMTNFGFNNTYGLAIRTQVAQKFGIKTYSDLAKFKNLFVFGAEYDFFEREDGFNPLKKEYDFEFKKVIDMDNGLKYRALFNSTVDVITVFTTDGQIQDPNLTVLKDDRKFYPTYRAGLVVRGDILNKYPKLEKVLNNLEGKIDEKTMASLNYMVEKNFMTASEVAKKFLVEVNK